MRHYIIAAALFLGACTSAHIPTRVEIEPTQGDVQRRCSAASRDMGMVGYIPTAHVPACSLVRLKPVEGAFYAGDIVLRADEDCVIVSTDSEFWINYEKRFRCSQARSSTVYGSWNRGVRAR